MINPIWLLLIPYCTLAFGIHGGEMYSGINRQLRNLACAIPFAIVAYFTWDFPEAVVAFALAYGGVSLGFAGQVNIPRLILKGGLTCPIGGFIMLPLVYVLSYKTKYTNILAEYGTGTVYGTLLFFIHLIFRSH